MFEFIPFELAVGFFFCLGAIFGSFGNVIILRWPKGESVVAPRSRCNSCQKMISWKDNIPILSWFILKGKCRNCGAKFSIRYPIIEFVSGVLFAAAFIRFGWSWNLIEMLPFLFGLLVVSVIDLDHFLLPDVFTLSGIVLGVVGSFLNPDRGWMDSLLGVMFGGGFLWTLAYFYFLLRKEDGMGGGDIKLLAWIGAILGWQAIPFVVVFSSVTGSIVGIWVAIRQNKGMKAMIPFGPYLALGAVIYAFAGKGLAEGPLAWLFPYMIQ